MQFVIRALSADRGVTELVVDAVDGEQARQTALDAGYFVSEVRSAGTRHGKAVGARKSRRAFNLVLFSQELLALLNAGLSIVEGLDALLEKERNPIVHGILSKILIGLRGGRRLSQVLADQLEHFSPLYIGILQAAEGTSDLPRSLGKFIDYQRRIDSVRNKVTSAMIYPAILLVVGGAVTSFLVGYVVPRFAEVYQGTGRSLPWMSELLLQWGRFAAHHAPALLLALALGLSAAVLGMRHLLRTRGIGRLLSYLPGLGEPIRVYALSRIYLTLGMLLEGGIPVVPAMNTIRSTVSIELADSVGAAITMVEQGTPVSAAFDTNGLTTPISLRMLRVGERSGELGKMLTQSALFYEDEISRWIERFTRAFEPLLMAAIGIVVGVIVVLLYMPIFDLAGSLS